MSSDPQFTMTQAEYSNALTLYTMFRHFEWHTVVKALRTCDNNLEAAIDKLLDSLPEKSLYDSETYSNPEPPKEDPVTKEDAEASQRVKELEQRVKELEEAKVRTEEEKKSAMRWCVSQMEQMKQQIQQQEEIIAKQSREIEEKNEGLKLRDSLNNHLVNVARQFEQKVELLQRQQSSVQQPQPDPIQQALEWGKDFVSTVGGQLATLESGIRTEFKKLEKDIANETKDWAIVDKVKDFASTFKDEIITPVLHKPSSCSHPSSSSSQTQTTGNVSADSLLVAYESMESEEEKQAWVASIQAYIQHLEGSVKRYEEMFQ